MIAGDEDRVAQSRPSMGDRKYLAILLINLPMPWRAAPIYSSSPNSLAATTAWARAELLDPGIALWLPLIEGAQGIAASAADRTRRDFAEGTSTLRLSSPAALRHRHAKICRLNGRFDERATCLRRQSRAFYRGPNSRSARPPAAGGCAPDSIVRNLGIRHLLLLAQDGAQLIVAPLLGSGAEAEGRRRFERDRFVV